MEGAVWRRSHRVRGTVSIGLLLAEALQEVTPGAPIIIVPDGILALLPFETLVLTPGRDVKDTRFVGDMWQLSYAQSATVLAFLRTLAPSAASQTFFALGNPIYDPQDPRYAAYKQGLPNLVLPAQALSAYGYRGRAIQRGGGKRRGAMTVRRPSAIRHCQRPKAR